MLFIRYWFKVINQLYYSCKCNTEYITQIIYGNTNNILIISWKLHNFEHKKLITFFKHEEFLNSLDNNIFLKLNLSLYFSNHLWESVKLQLGWWPNFISLDIKSALNLIRFLLKLSIFLSRKIHICNSVSVRCNIEFRVLINVSATSQAYHPLIYFHNNPSLYQL